MAGETRRPPAGRRVPTMPLSRREPRETGRDAEHIAAGAARIAAALAVAVLAAAGASVHALIFWTAALFLLVRFGDLEALLRDDDRPR